MLGTKSRNHIKIPIHYFVNIFPYNSYDSDHKVKTNKRKKPPSRKHLNWDFQTKYFPGQFSAIKKGVQ